MPFRVSWNPRDGLVEIRYEGDVSPAELQSAYAEATGVVCETRARKLLAECRRLRGGHSVFDLYALAARFSEQAVTARLREAVIAPEIRPAAEHAEFWETACRNRGLDVAVFLDRASAVAWLQRPPD